MNGPVTTPSLPDSGELRRLLTSYSQSSASETERIRDELHTLFSAYADALVPIERSLATINAEVDLFARSTCGWRDRTMQPLNNLVMMCCLECYYPEPRLVSV